MSLTEVEQLQAALIQRAEALAREYRAEGQLIAARITQERQERLRQNEALVVEQARVEAERLQQRRTQAEVLHLQAEWDRVRWQAVQTVIGGLTERFRRYVVTAEYPSLLCLWLAEAAQALPPGDLEVHANARDREALARHVAELNAEWAGVRRLSLAAAPIITLGGCVVYAAEGRVRVDNSFEGRLARLREAMERLTLVKLFVGKAHG